MSLLHINYVSLRKEVFSFCGQLRPSVTPFCCLLLNFYWSLNSCMGSIFWWGHCLEMWCCHGGRSFCLLLCHQDSLSGTQTLKKLLHPYSPFLPFENNLKEEITCGHVVHSHCWTYPTSLLIHSYNVSGHGSFSNICSLTFPVM